MVKLKPYQEKCSEMINFYKHCFLKMETGAGKTFTALFSVDSDTIVIVQNKDSRNQWIKSIELLNLNFKIDVFTNYELSNNIGKKDYNYFNPFHYKNLIFDETQGITNPSSKRSKMCKKMFKGNNYEKIIAMTYTPIRKNEVDIFTICNNLHMKIPLIQNYPFLDLFHEEFFWYHDIWDYRTGKLESVPDEFNVTKQELFNSMINIITYEFPEEKAEDENERQFKKHKWYIPLQKKNMELYNYVKRAKTLQGYHNTLGGGTKHVILQEIANSTVKLQFENKITDNDYLEKFEVIDNIIKKHGKIIIVYQFSNELKILKSYFKNGTSQLKAFDKKDGKFNVLFRQIKRCASLDVMTCDTMVFFSMNFSADNFIQMHGRITRTASEFIDVYYYYLIFENTIEKDRYDVCIKKKTKNDVIKELN